jgi:single-stranded DNA-binding protein
MKEITYLKDENFVDITGTISDLPDYCKYIPRPLIAFNLSSVRKRKSIEQPIVTDENRIVLFDNEEFHLDFNDGDRIRVKGELQSRNYTRDNHEVDELILMAVANYIEIWNELPSAKEPKGKIRQPIEWKKLMDVGLLPEVPSDSMYLADGTKDKNADAPFVYRIDDNGEVFKETEHVAYEIVAKKIERLTEEIDPIIGDKNKVVILGKVTRNPNFNFLGTVNKVAFFSFNLRTKSQFFEGRVFYNNIISWSKLAEDAFENIKINDYVKVIGRLQSREYTKEITRRWVTPSGNKKKKKIELTLLTREISSSKIEKCIVKDESDK